MSRPRTGDGAQSAFLVTFSDTLLNPLLITTAHCIAHWLPLKRKRANQKILLLLPSPRGVFLFPTSLLILCQSFATSMNAQRSFKIFDAADSITYSEENPMPPPDKDHATSRCLQLPRAEQIGATIFGDSAMEIFGPSMAVSADGRFIAVGALYDDYTHSRSGIVRVMENQNNSWKRIGNDIATDGDGISAVAISCDGSTIAYHSEQDARPEPLEAPVYKLGGTWNKVGEILPGSSSLYSTALSATSLSLSGDGTVVALGWFGIEYNVTSQIRIYKWNGDVWQEMGNIQSHWDDDGISTVALSEDGSVVAVGISVGYYLGPYIMVLQWDGGGWVQLGSDIQLGNNLVFGVGLVPIDISSGGDILAVGGSTSDDQPVQIFELINGDWQQLGQDITGKDSNDSFGYSVSISGDGSVVAVGGYSYHQSVGYVRVFRFDGIRWQQIYYDIDGEASSDYFGTTVSMSKDGSTVAVGSTADRIFGNRDRVKGFFKVYSLGVSTFIAAERDCSSLLYNILIQCFQPSSSLPYVCIPCKHHPSL
eukprot:scaffold3046_cov105-Cylindrotheca_fusiformis.AAC.6